MKTLVKMVFGSQVYGTSTPKSDTDYKMVFVPTAEDILFQRAEKTILEGTNLGHSKNTAKDVDIELFSIQKYMRLLLEGQTVALDMLFVPKEYWIESTPEWEYIVSHREKFLHSKVLSFVGYCRTQANKYGIKGSRMNSIKTSLQFFKDVTSVKSEMRLEDTCERVINTKEGWDYLEHPLEIYDHIEMVECKGPNGKMLPHLEICNRKFGMREKIPNLVAVLEKIYNEYGARARKAEKNDGVDWKALMHAVRIKNQAIELLDTGNITFPRPEREHLLQIRSNDNDEGTIFVPYADVAKEIEDGLDKIEGMYSKLPEQPDHDFAKQIVMDMHLHEVLRSAWGY